MAAYVCFGCAKKEEKRKIQTEFSAYISKYEEENGEKSCGIATFSSSKDLRHSNVAVVAKIFFSSIVLLIC